MYACWMVTLAALRQKMYNQGRTNESHFRNFLEFFQSFSESCDIENLPERLLMNTLNTRYCLTFAYSVILYQLKIPIMLEDGFL